MTTKKSHSKVEQNRGITLIALIIIIVVLLILAGISIAMLTGNNTIVKNAQEAKIETEIAQFVEKVKIIVSGAYNEKGNFDGEKLKSDLTNEGIDYTIKDEEIWIEKPYGGYIIISIKTGEIKEEGGSTAGQYTIKYNANGGTGTMENQTLKLNESKALIDNQFEREGYIFGGWSKEENGEKAYNGGEVVTNVTTNKDEEVNLYAVWVATTYAVTYELNGGTLEADNPTYTTYDTEIIMDNPTKTGYEFAGWTITGMTPTSHKIGETVTSVETISGIKDTTFKNLRNDVGTVTFTAIWTAKTDTPYTVNHYLMDTTGNYPNQDKPTATQNLAGKSDEALTLTSLQQPYTGLQYSYGQVDGKTVTETTISSNGSRVINLYYTRNRPTISFNGNGGTNPAAITDYYEVPITTKPTREGHTFNGWYTSASGGTQVEKIPAENTTLYAHWTVQQFTMSFNANGGSVSPASKTYNYGATIDISPSRTGYRFDGWFDNATNGNRVTTVPAGNKTLYAHWTAQQYTITFNGNGGSTPTALKANAGTNITATSSRTKYRFDGWFDNATNGNKVTTVPAENKTLYAHWTLPLGTEVTVGGENFYVIEDSPQNATTLKILTKYALHTSSSIYQSIDYAEKHYMVRSTPNPKGYREVPPSETQNPELLKSIASKYGATEAHFMTKSEFELVHSSTKKDILKLQLGAGSAWWWMGWIWWDSSDVALVIDNRRLVMRCILQYVVSQTCIDNKQKQGIVSINGVMFEALSIRK